MSRFFAYLDKIDFLNIPVWDFSVRSVFTEYGSLFFRKLIFAHPLRTIKGIRRYRKFLKGKGNIADSYSHFLFSDEEALLTKKIPAKSSPLVGLGFCLKPLDRSQSSLSCPSGRANHDCLFLEQGQTQPICAQCKIHKISLRCLEFGFPVYIMTSAKDIALDMMIPQINDGMFPMAILLLCPYSVKAIPLPLFICGTEFFLLAYDQGFCKNFDEWRRADLGDKDEITELRPSTLARLLEVFERFTSSESRSQRFQRKGNIFFPVV